MILGCIIVIGRFSLSHSPITYGMHDVWPFITVCKYVRMYILTYTLSAMLYIRTVRLIKKFTFRTVVNMHICVVHLTYLTLLLPRTYVLAGVRVYRLKFLRSLAN